MFIATESNKKILALTQENLSESTQDLNVDVEVEVQVTETRKPSCSEKLGEYVIDEFNNQISIAIENPDGTITVRIPYPASEDFYDECFKTEREFIPVACVANPKFIRIVHSEIIKQNPELAATHTFKIAARPTEVEILVRPKPAVEVVAVPVAAPVNRYQAILNTASERGHPFPIPEEVKATLDAAVPHEEGLSRSVAYTVGSNENGVSLFCRRLGLKYCLPKKDQPKQEGLIRFRVFAEDKEGFVEKQAKKAPGGPSKKAPGGPGKNVGGGSARPV